MDHFSLPVQNLKKNKRKIKHALCKTGMHNKTTRKTSNGINNQKQIILLV